MPLERCMDNVLETILALNIQKYHFKEAQEWLQHFQVLISLGNELYQILPFPFQTVARETGLPVSIPFQFLLPIQTFSILYLKQISF